MNALEEWTASACRALGLDSSEVDRNLVLELSRDVAHQVARPAAPVTAYLLGLAAGRGADPDTAAATLRSMVQRPPWTP